MRNRVLALAGGLALAMAGPAWADGFQSYRVCGGDTFTTCAAVEINVVGSNVTMRVWNLSGNPHVMGHNAGNSLGRSIIDGIGFYNVPAGLAIIPGSLTVTGSTRPGDNAAVASGSWQIDNNGSVMFSTDFRARTAGTYDGGIESGCDPNANPSSVSLFRNACTELNSSGWVTFNFTTNGVAWDPTTSDISIRARDLLTDNAQLPNGVTECSTGITPGGRQPTCLPVTVSPEPVTMTLLASGLAGMGGAGFWRRRRNRNQLS
jgi:MYXO-CTERM domain-containing protein